MTKQNAIIKKPDLTFIGITCRTSNAPDKAPLDIAALWNKFNADNIYEVIPDKASYQIYVLYCEYEKDHTKPYTVLIGCLVNKENSSIDGLTTITIPASCYEVFEAEGEFPQSLINTWNKIWHAPIKRTYTGDFEEYDPQFFLKSNHKVPIYIAIDDDRN